MAQVPSGVPSSAQQAPGQGPYDHNQGNGNHMPPPSVPPLNIPQNNNPGPSAMSAGDQGMLSPGGGSIRRAAPEPNKRALYVGGLDTRVTEDVLQKIFETAGHVQSVKIIPDKTAKGSNYGFVEYDDPAAAERAMSSLNGRRVHSNEIKVNWAYQSSTATKEDTSGHAHIFVGDLSNEVNDEVLLQAFSTFGNVSEARVMWDMKTGRSRGYGFVAFRDRTEAEKALSSMDGEWLGSRTIRCNWANQKGQPTMNPGQPPMPSNMGMPGMPAPSPSFGGHHQFPAQGPQSYDVVVQQTPQWQTTCYVGNLSAYTSHHDLIPLFLNFGYIVETRWQSDRGFAFIKMDSHENAANAICNLNGYNVNGRPLKCSWGKDRPPTQQFDFSPASGGPSQGYGPPTPQGYAFPQYGGPPAMSPSGPSPGGHYNQQSPGYPPQQGFGNAGPSPGGYGRGGQNAGNYMGQPQAAPYGGYNGGYQA